MVALPGSTSLKIPSWDGINLTTSQSGIRACEPLSPPWYSADWYDLVWAITTWADQYNGLVMFRKHCFTLVFSDFWVFQSYSHLSAKDLPPRCVVAVGVTCVCFICGWAVHWCLFHQLWVSALATAGCCCCCRYYYYTHTSLMKSESCIILCVWRYEFRELFDIKSI